MDRGATIHISFFRKRPTSDAPRKHEGDRLGAGVPRFRLADATRRRIVIRVALVLVCALCATQADADGDASSTALPLRRYELAGFPIIGGSTDIGVQFGGAATFTRFYDQAFPYAWNIDLLLSASIKDENGVRLAQQSHVLRLDAPDLWSGKLRLDTRASFQRTINLGYYGLGNAASATPNRYYQYYWYLQQEGRVRSIMRLHTPVRGLDAAIGANLRYEAPQLYTSPVDGPSKLSQDVAQSQAGSGPQILGSESALLASLSAGVMYDTRDSEFVTRHGAFYQAGMGATLGSSERIAYGEAAAVLAHYASLARPLVFASRFVASFEFGRVPFYDLAQGGIFEPQYLLGGETGVRGVPQGRYAGRVKIVSNLEIRATPFPRFKVVGQSLLIGTTTFFDAGRVWEDYAIISRTDGDHLGLKFGVGVGAFLQWGQAAIFRIEIAYSPDAEAENANLPFGIYVSDGLMF
ncbi:MAG: BamA/TamA family outer membrane protein [Polyangiaceae bacterium]|jgi:hypothetical protein